MTKSELFIKAHQIAKAINTVVGCYQIAFSIALKAAYNNQKLSEQIAINILAPEFDYDQNVAAFTIYRKTNTYYGDKAIVKAVARVRKGIKHDVDITCFGNLNFKDGKFEKMFINGVPTWILREKYVDRFNFKALKRMGETEKAVKFHVEYDLHKIYSKDTMVNHEDFFFDTIINNTHTDIWVPKTVMCSANL